MSKIIVGVDESDGARDAIALASRFAQLDRASMLLVNAFPYDDRPSRVLSRAYEEYLREGAQRLLDDLRGSAGAGVEVETLAVPRTSPAHGLQDVAEREEARLIVVGSTHTGHAGRVLPGSTAERLAHGAPCALAVAPRGYAGRPVSELGVVGCAYDGSADADAALEAGYQLALAANARLRVLRVFKPLAFDLSPGFTDAGLPTYNDALRDRAAQEVEEAIQRLDRGGRVSSALTVGDPVDGLVDASEGLDVLVLGSRGYGPLHAVIVGGVSGRVMRAAACPVMVIPRGVETRHRLPFAGAVTLST